MPIFPDCFCNGKVLAENAVDIGKLCNLMVQVPKENPELNNARLQVKLYKTADITKLWKYNTIGNYELMNNYEYSFINGNNVIEKIKVKLNEIDSNCRHGSRLFALCHFFCHKSKPLPFLCCGIAVYFI